MNQLNLRNTITVALAFCVFSAAIAQAESTTPSPKTYLQPALLTSCGQAADVLILKGLCARAGIQVKYEAQATSDSLNGIKTVILVAGGSSKGLGAAKVNVGAEESRIKKLAAAAKKAKIPVLIFHIGGEGRRGSLSDPFNKLAAQNGEQITVVSGGDDDELFKKIATENKAGYQVVETQAALVPYLKNLFPAPKTEPGK
jgi:hypothetical protein